MTVSCHSCHSTFADFKELALHISSTRKGHRKGRKWAAKYIILNSLSPNKKNDRNYQRVALTETEKANKKETRRELSGETEYATTICPHCFNKGRPLLPVEFATSPIAWRIKGMLVKMCFNCGGQS